MKWNSETIVLVAVLLLSATILVQGASAQQYCCDRSGLVGAVDLTFMKYMQEGGVADADGAGANFDLEWAPRFELGYMGKRDLGLRSRYWFYDAHTLSNDGDSVGVDAYYVDVEAFHNRLLGCRTLLEFSAGLRYLDFRQDAEGGCGTYLFTNEFDGWGGTFAVEAKHPVWVGNVYVRGRWSILLGKGDLAYIGTTTVTDSAHDTNATLTELGIGYEVCRDMGRWGTGVISAGGEWQTWANMALGDTAFGGIGNDDVMEDAGFAGIALRFELRR